MISGSIKPYCRPTNCCSEEKLKIGMDAGASRSRSHVSHYERHCYCRGRGMPYAVSPNQWPSRIRWRWLCCRSCWWHSGPMKLMDTKVGLFLALNSFEGMGLLRLRRIGWCLDWLKQRGTGLLLGGWLWASNLTKYRSQNRCSAVL